ncbi:MAG: hypothetical protein ACK4M1_04160 [Flavobacterium sp.]
MSTAGANAIGLLVEKFQEFLEWIFEPKRKSDFEKLRDIDEYLKKDFDININEIIESDFTHITFKIENIEIRILDQLILLIYQSNLNNAKPDFLKNINEQQLYLRLMELIEFAEKKSKKLSLDRNNLKNSLQQLLK